MGDHHRAGLGRGGNRPAAGDDRLRRERSDLHRRRPGAVAFAVGDGRRPGGRAGEQHGGGQATPAIGGTPQVGEELTVSTSGVSDADGLDNASFGYQWIRADTDIGGATGSTYTPVPADEGKRLKVRVSFTDDAGHEESLTSAATDAVAAAPELPDGELRGPAGRTPRPGVVQLPRGVQRGDQYQLQDGARRVVHG